MYSTARFSTLPDRQLATIWNTTEIEVRSERKRRLLSCAFVRQVLHLLPDDGYRLGVETCERFADGQAEWKDMLAARKFLTKVWPITQGRGC